MSTNRLDDLDFQSGNFQYKGCKASFSDDHTLELIQEPQRIKRDYTNEAQYGGPHNRSYHILALGLAEYVEKWQHILQQHQDADNVRRADQAAKQAAEVTAAQHAAQRQEAQEKSQEAYKKKEERMERRRKLKEERDMALIRAEINKEHDVTAKAKFRP